MKWTIMLAVLVLTVQLGVSRTEACEVEPVVLRSPIVSNYSPVTPATSAPVSASSGWQTVRKVTPSNVVNASYVTNVSEMNNAAQVASQPPSLLPTQTLPIESATTSCSCAPAATMNYLPVQYPATSIVPVTAYAPAIAYRPVVSTAALPANYTIGRGILGQPVLYVPGQPIRNALRYLSP